jgi:hypothetical protein
MLTAKPIAKTAPTIARSVVSFFMYRHLLSVSVKNKKERALSSLNLVLSPCPIEDFLEIFLNLQLKDFVLSVGNGVKYTVSIAKDILYFKHLLHLLLMFGI